MSAGRNDSLKDLLISRGFRPDAARAVEALAEWREVDSGETLLASGRIAGMLGILTAGSADVLGRSRDEKDTVVASVERADLVGWEALLGAQPTLFSFRVRRAARLWEISAERLKVLSWAEPQAAISLADMALSTMLRIQRETGARRGRWTADAPTEDGRRSPPIEVDES